MEQNQVKKPSKCDSHNTDYVTIKSFVNEDWKELVIVIKGVKFSICCLHHNFANIRINDTIKLEL